MTKRRWLSRLIVLCLIVSLCMEYTGIGSFPVSAAKNIPMTLQMAKQIGLANSPDYEKLESELSVKEVSLKQAIKSINEKRKNMSTFRWTPLLSFKFPEKPDLAEEYEFEFKPIEIQAEIDTIKHSMTDTVLAVYEEVTLLYLDIVIDQITLEFTQEILKEQEETLKKNRTRLKYGEANESDVETIEKNVEALKSQMSTLESSLVANKKKMSNTLGMDVTTGYTFSNPFTETEIPRSALEMIIQHTLDNDDTYYEVSMNATTAGIALDTNYSLMKSQYGDKMSYISDFVNQAKDGQKINGKAFKAKYEEFLKAIDKPWQGKIRILFVKIPKEWFKGQISGIRYVEDEPYALYESALEYQDALLEKNNTKLSITQEVEDTFNGLVSMRKAYLSTVEGVEAAEKQLKEDAIRNRLGELTYEEYQDSVESYEELQNDMTEALAEYAKSLYSFDRLTCGAVTAFLEGTSVSLGAGSGGTSYLEEEFAEGAHYYIEPIIQEQEFRLHVSIPDDFDLEITHFELWNGQVQIGERTEIDKSLRHLSISIDGDYSIKIRFYNGSDFVDDCVINANEYSGELVITKDYQMVTQESMEVGSYSIQSNPLTGMLAISMAANGEENIRFYRIKNAAGTCLGSEAQIAIDKEFVYLSLIQNSLEALIIEFYAEDGSLLYTGYFDTGNMKLKKNPEE